MNTRQRSATLCLRLDPEIKAKAMKAAKDDRRTLTSLVESLLATHLRNGGYLPPLHDDQGKAGAPY